MSHTIKYGMYKCNIDIESNKNVETRYIQKIFHGLLKSGNFTKKMDNEKISVKELELVFRTQQQV